MTTLIVTIGDGIYHHSMIIGIAQLEVEGETIGEDIILTVTGLYGHHAAIPMAITIDSIHASTVLYLFVAARGDHVEGELIHPAAVIQT